MTNLRTHDHNLHPDYPDELATVCQTELHLQETSSNLPRNMNSAD